MTGKRWSRARAWGVRLAITRSVTRRAYRRARRVGLGRNGLRRRSDRIEAVGLIVAWLLVLAMVPLAVAVGTSVHQAGLATAATGAATRHQVPALLLAPAPLSIEPQSGAAGKTFVLARWETPDGVQRTAQIRATRELRPAPLFQCGSTHRIKWSTRR